MRFISVYKKKSLFILRNIPITRKQFVDRIQTLFWHFALNKIPTELRTFKINSNKMFKYEGKVFVREIYKGLWGVKFCLAHSKLNVVQRSLSLNGCFSDRKRTAGAHWIWDWLGLRACSNVLERRKNLLSLARIKRQFCCPARRPSIVSITNPGFCCSENITHQITLVCTYE